MIAHLRGVVLDKTPESAVVEAGGVGYEVVLSAAAARALPDVGREARVQIHTHVVQDGPTQLYGFADAGERALFRTLLGVQGIGPRVALAILSGLPAAELVRAISTGDIGLLTKIRGVGRKTAERMAVELRDKLGAVGAGAVTRGGAGGLPFASGPTGAPEGKLGDVWGALVGLGFRPGEIDGVLANLDPEQETAALVKQALAALRRR